MEVTLVLWGSAEREREEPERRRDGSRDEGGKDRGLFTAFAANGEDQTGKRETERPRNPKKISRMFSSVQNRASR